MSLTHLSPLGIALGALALIGVTYALHILRVRHREQRVVTTMFWRQAIKEERARAFRERFRHPLAWLLVTAIALLAFSGVARPIVRLEPDYDAFIVVDAGATTTPEDLARDLGTASRVAHGLPDEVRSVYALDGTARRLLGPDEPEALLDERGRSVRPVAAPSGIDRSLPMLVGRSGRPVRVYLIGRLTPREETLHRIAEAHESEVDWFRVEAERGVELGEAPKRPALHGFGVDPVLGVTATISGLRGGDVSLSFRDGSGGGGTVGLEVPGRRSERKVARFGSVASSSGELLEVSWADLPNYPGRLELRFGGESAFAHWPGRPVIDVAFDWGGDVSSEVQTAFRQVVEADPSLRAVGVGPTVRAVIGSGASASLRLMAPAEAESTFVFTGLAPAGLGRLVERTGLSELDADELANTLGRPVTASTEEGRDRRVSIDRSVFAGESRLIESRVFPVLVRESIRWVAGESEPVSRAAVGEPIDALVGQELRWSVPGDSGDRERSVTSLDRAFVPAFAGSYRDSNGRAVEASLQTPIFSGAPRVDPASAPLDQIEVVGPPTRGVVLGLDRWLLLIVLGLLVFEWVSVRRGRMP